MEVIVHRGTHQIGGCATEYRTKSTRIFVDFGAELDGESAKVLDIEGVTKGITDCDAVFFTHYHGDHMGLLDTINRDVPLYMGEASKKIAEILNDRLIKASLASYNTKRLKGVRTFTAARPVIIGDIKITPYLVDHSAYDAYMFKIEADGKTLLHTGDFRTHGFRGKGVKPALEKYVGKVDGLVCEGTTLNRTDAKCETEAELKNRIKEVLLKNKYVFVVCSSTNIDRLAGICSVIPKGRYCVCDNYQLSLIEYIRGYAGGKSPLYKFPKTLWYSNKLEKAMEDSGFCMFVRSGNSAHRKIMESYRDKKPVVIYSMWKGYLKQENVKSFLKGYRRLDMHTSGHADRDAIKMVIDTVKPDVIVPMHTEVPEEFLKLAGDKKIILLKDGEKFKMSKNYRGLENGHGLLAKLSDGGDLHKITEKVKCGNGYWMGIRNNKVMVYYMGGKILEISSKGNLSFDSEYIEFYNKQKRTNEKVIKSFDNQDKWLSAENLLRTTIDFFQKNKSKKEKMAQQEIMLENNKCSKAEWFLVDMEYSVPGISYGRFDMIAVSKKKNKDGKHTIALVELKTGTGSFGGTTATTDNQDNVSIKKYGSGIAGHINNFYEFLYGTNGSENVENLAKEIVLILSNYRSLGIDYGGLQLEEKDIELSPQKVECIIMCTDLKDRKKTVEQAKKYIFNSRGSSKYCLENLWGNSFDTKLKSMNISLSVVDRERIIDRTTIEKI